MTESIQRSNGRKRSPKAEEPALDRNNMRARGQRTRNEIIAAARKLLLESGSLEFTLREVAVRAGISISNLQYYFPTRLAVLRAVVEPVIEAYMTLLQRALESRATPRTAMEALAQQALVDARDKEKTVLWWHLASVSSIDEECSRMFDDWYEAVTRGIADLIHANSPDCKMADCLHRATLIVAMADGLSFQLSAGRRKRNYTRGIDTKFMAVVDNILAM